MVSPWWRGGGEVGLSVRFEEVVEDCYAGVLGDRSVRLWWLVLEVALQSYMLLARIRQDARARTAS